MPLPFHRRRLDPDAADFCRRSGATDRAAINAFVKGVKDLGLWDKMVCWPLRSSQNVGFGDTVHSLGGLGAYDMTLTGGPAWTADGVSFDGTDDYASANWPNITTEITAMAVHKVVSTSAQNRVVQFRGAVSGGLWSPFSDSVAYWDAINPGLARTSGALGATADTFFGHVGLANSAGISQWRNGATQISSSATPASFNYTPTVVEIGRSGTAVAYQGTVAFALLAQASSVSAAALHTLYRNTLGTGLGLP